MNERLFAQNQNMRTLNADQEAFGNIQQADVKNYMPRAYCSSIECSGHMARLVRKAAKKTSDYCPDCGSALFWK